VTSSGAGPADSPWAISHYTHWNNYNICKINYQHIASLDVRRRRVGRRWDGAYECDTPKKSGKFFTGNYHVNFGYFVNFSYNIFDGLISHW